MAYDNDTRGGYRERDGGRGEWRRESGRGGREGGGDGGGFFERAGEQISSWFAGDDDGRRSEEGQRSEEGRRPEGRTGEHQRYGRPERGGHDRGWSGGGDRERQRDQDRGGWFGGGSPGSEHGEGAQDYPRQWDLDREQYGRGGGGQGGRERQQNSGPQQVHGRHNQHRGRYEEDERSSYAETRRGGGRGRDERDEPRGVGAGSSLASAAGGHFGDPHYHEWRQRQIDELDRDYEEYRREHQSEFANHFANWRTQRQSKRQLVGQIRPHMEVVGSDEQRIGTVDEVRDDRIVLTRNDPEAGGVHRSFACTLVERVEGERLVLNQPADEARRQLRQEGEAQSATQTPSRQTEPAQATVIPPTTTVTEQPATDQGVTPAGQQSDGPHILDRSFSGTYR